MPDIYKTELTTAVPQLSSIISIYLIPLKLGVLSFFTHSSHIAYIITL